MEGDNGWGQHEMEGVAEGMLPRGRSEKGVAYWMLQLSCSKKMVPG